MVRDSLVEEIRSRADLVEICGEHMPLKKVGKTFRGPCPLHGGDDPNFSIDPTRGIFKCFVCGEGGDVFSFVMKHLGHDFPSAVRYVGEQVGVQVPDREEDRPDPHRRVREAVAFAGEWFQRQLLEEEVGAAARDYLSSRGIDRQEAERYALGYAPDSWRALREAASSRGVEDEVLLEAGLLATSERASEPYDRFRHRLVFSIQDLRDRPVGFGGRALDPDDETPKYINSPDSPIFHKGNTLYGLNWARHAMRRQEMAMVVEGYTDALSLHIRGLETAVAPLGTALTDQQAETLVRYANRVYLLYDSDDAGLRATFKAADRLLAAGGQPMVVTLPEGEDPDSVVRDRGVDALREYVEDAVNAVERKLQELEIRGYLDSVEGRRRAVDGLLSTLRAARDPALRDLYVARAAERIGVREETLREEVRRSERSRGRGAPRRERGPRRPSGRTGTGGPGRGVSPGSGERRAERNLLLLLLRDPSFVGRAAEAGLDPELFQSDRYRRIFRRLSEAREEDAHGEWSEVFEDEQLEAVEELLEDATELTHPEEIFRHSLSRILYRPQFERMREIDRLLGSEEVGEEKMLELGKEKQEIANRLREEGVRVGLERKFLF